MMSCEQIQEHLSAYLDEELSPEQSRMVREHLEACSACREVLDDLRSVSGLLQRLPHRAAPAGLADDVQARLERSLLLDDGGESTDAVHSDRSIPHRRPSVWPRVAAIAASVVLAFGIFLLIVFPPGQNGVSPTSPAVNDKADGEQSSLAGDAARRDEEMIAGYALKGGQAGPGAPVVEPGKAGVWARGGRLSEAMKHGQSKAGITNRLVLVTNDSPAAADQEMNRILADNGITNLHRRVEAVRPAAVLHSNFYNAAKMRKPADQQAMPATNLNVNETVIRYEGVIPVSQIAQLNDALAANGRLTVQDNSEGIFVALPRTQQTVRGLQIAAQCDERQKELGFGTKNELDQRSESLSASIQARATEPAMPASETPDTDGDWSGFKRDIAKTQDGAATKTENDVTDENAVDTLSMAKKVAESGAAGRAVVGSDSYEGENRTQQDEKTKRGAETAMSLDLADAGAADQPKPSQPADTPNKDAASPDTKPGEEESQRMARAPAVMPVAPAVAPTAAPDTSGGAGGAAAPAKETTEEQCPVVQTVTVTPTPEKDRSQEEKRETKKQEAPAEAPGEMTTARRQAASQPGGPTAEQQFSWNMQSPRPAGDIPAAPQGAAEGTARETGQRGQTAGRVAMESQTQAQAAGVMSPAAPPADDMGETMYVVIELVSQTPAAETAADDVNVNDSDGRAAAAELFRQEEEGRREMSRDADQQAAP